MYFHGVIHLGTSGYVYDHWRHLFYPRGLPTKRWLQHYARVFSTVELNATFYRLPTPSAVDGWREGTPRGFRFAAKGSRYLTHMKRLKDAGPGIEKYFELILRLRRKLSVVLWQLPPQMNKADPERLARFLEKLPRPHGLRHVVEFRSDAWYVPQICEVLDSFGADGHRAGRVERLLRQRGLRQRLVDLLLPVDVQLGADVLLRVLVRDDGRAGFSNRQWGGRGARRVRRRDGRRRSRNGRCSGG